MSRQPTPLDVADHESLIRIATLAARVMGTLRTPGRGKWDSKRTLRKFLADDGVPLTTADLSPALALLEATKRISRPEVKPRTLRVQESSPNGRMCGTP
jgi:hypothetical protein